MKHENWELVRLSSISGPFAIRMDYDGERTFYGAQMIAREKDAQLMVAAPKLLKALKRLLEYGDVFRYRDGEVSPYEQALEAIRKAEGGD